MTEVDLPVEDSARLPLWRLFPSHLSFALPNALAKRFLVFVQVRLWLLEALG